MISTSRHITVRWQARAVEWQAQTKPWSYGGLPNVVHSFNVYLQCLEYISTQERRRNDCLVRRSNMRIIMFKPRYVITFLGDLRQSYTARDHRVVYLLQDTNLLGTLISDRRDPYQFSFYCSATHVTSQVLQPRSVNKRYRGHVYQCPLSLSFQTSLLNCQSTFRATQVVN